MPIVPEALRLLVIVNAGPGDRLPDLQRVEAALRGGATLIQIRAKEAPARTTLAAVHRLAPLCREAGAALFVNDRPDLALAAAADGVHVGPQDLSPERVRRVVGSLGLGVSARTPDRVKEAERARADYLGVEALRATGSKADAEVIGPEGIAAIIRTTRIPVVAIGGVRPCDAGALRRAGAAGLAVLGGVMDAEDPQAAARRYREAWESG